jgi:hypothetical protein
MTGKLRILTFLFCAAFAQARAQNVKADNVLPRLVVDGFELSARKNTGRYLYLNAFIVNNSDNTLKYWGTRQKFRELFEVTGSDDLQLVDQSDGGPLYEQMVVPPHRSQHFDLRLLMGKTPEGGVGLKITMKFYRWFNTNDFENDRKFHTPIILSDNVANSFHSDGDSFRADPIGDEQKHEQILPPMEFPLLTANERALLSVTIDEKKTGKPVDTIHADKNARAISVPVTIHNYGKDTLKYLSYTCSWEEYYHLDNKKLTIELFTCDYNVEHEVIIPPGDSHTETLPIVYHLRGEKGLERFRVGVNINIHAHDLAISPRYNYAYQLMSNNIVWSKDVWLKTE